MAMYQENMYGSFLLRPFKKDVSKQKKIDEQTVIYKDTENTPAVKTAGSSIYTAIKFGQEVIVNNV